MRKLWVEMLKILLASYLRSSYDSILIPVVLSVPLECTQLWYVNVYSCITCLPYLVQFKSSLSRLPVLKPYVSYDQTKLQFGANESILFESDDPVRGKARVELPL